jgi:hypothetical protein
VHDGHGPQSTRVHCIRRRSAVKHHVSRLFHGAQPSSIPGSSPHKRASSTPIERCSTAPSRDCRCIQQFYGATPASTVPGRDRRRSAVEHRSAPCFPASGCQAPTHERASRPRAVEHRSPPCYTAISRQARLTVVSGSYSFDPRGIQVWHQLLRLGEGARRIELQTLRRSGTIRMLPQFFQECSIEGLKGCDVI